jgi:hypothetical protein
MGKPLKATVSKTHKRGTGIKGLPPTRGKRAMATGELVDRPCSRCNVPLLAPTDIDVVTCGRCVLGVASGMINPELEAIL